MYDIIVNYGKDIYQCTYEALTASNLSHLVHSGMKVMLKPNMVLAKPPSLGATTHPEVCEAVIVFLQSLGIKKITIAESAWIGDETQRAYKVCGYDKLAARYHVRLVDLKKDKTQTVTTEGIKMEICREALDTDFLINLPVLKAHCQTRLTCNMKNLKGVISDNEKRRFHAMGLNKPIAALNKAIKTHFCVVDGICGDLTFEEGGNPVERNMILVGENPLLIDSYAAGLIGFSPDEIPYLGYGVQMGLGTLFNEDTKLLTLNKDSKPTLSGEKSGLVKKLSRMVDERQACSACYSALIFALHKEPFAQKIRIGQGFKGQTGEGIGIGRCTKGFSSALPGCPPTAGDIVDFLRRLPGQYCERN